MNPVQWHESQLIFHHICQLGSFQTEWVHLHICIWIHFEQSGAISIQDKRKGAKNLLAEGFYSFLFALHHTPLSDINFELLLGKLVGSFQAK